MSSVPAHHALSFDDDVADLQYAYLTRACGAFRSTLRFMTKVHRGSKP